MSYGDICGIVLTFETVNEILRCDHANETSSAVLSHGTICFVGFEKNLINLAFFIKFLLRQLIGVKGLKLLL